MNIDLKVNNSAFCIYLAAAIIHQIKPCNMQELGLNVVL